MRTITVRAASKSYEVRIGKDAADVLGEQAKKVCPGALKALVVSETNVAPYYLDKVKTNLAEAGFEVIDYVFYNGEEYALLTEVTDEETSEDDKQECIVCSVTAETEEDGEETESFIPVEDENLAQKLVDIFNTKMADEEKEDE